MAFRATKHQSKSTKRGLVSVQNTLTHALFGLICFYLGLMIGMSSASSPPPASSVVPSCPACPKCPESGQESKAAPQASNNDQNNSVNADKKFPASLKSMFVDYATVPREQFNDFLEIGVPLDDTQRGAEDVLVLYTSEQSKPTTVKAKIGMDAQDAVENCATVKIILQEPWSRGQPTKCLAIMPQWESYYIHKFMRLPESHTGKLDLEEPLRYVSRAHGDKGTYQKVPDLNYHTEPFYAVLVEYLRNLSRLLDELKPLLQDMLSKAEFPKSNTIIVQVCNYGQVELFHNFLCSAKARNLDTSHIFMFATDKATYDLCQTLGIPAYYDHAIFGDLPESAARSYGDRTFSKMMMAKVYCVHLVLTLGHNVLFQDVDVVWYKNPLPYFQTKEAQKWDMMYQDDGARSIRYAPYSPNTGFYFVRHNAETVYFFGMLLRMGDNIAKTTSHQAALTALLNEHVSWKGLRVKVWKRGETNAFPGGFEYHRKKDIMKPLLQGNATTDPYIFHMSWTKNKDNKKLYYQQMGEWYTREDCLTGFDCCLPEPEIVCHYRDKPSKIPCRDVPPIDKGKPSFW